MKTDKILYACKDDNCGKVVACSNIFSKNNVVVCEYCGVKDNCNMRTVPLKYAETFKIKQTVLCDQCLR